MRSSKIFILIVVALLVFGSAAFCAYTLFVKPYSSFHLFRRHKTTVTAPPITDRGETAFNSAVTLQNSGKLEEAVIAWRTWLQAYPESKRRLEALDNLGKANIDLLHSPSTAGGKESYLVVKGDSLDRIATKKKSNPELIQQINALPNINLQIGQELFIPQLQINVVLDRQNRSLTLLNGDQFFKSYPLLSTPPATSAKEITTVIVDKVAMNGSKRVAFGDKRYAGSERIIILRSCGNIVTAPAETPSTEPGATPAAMPPGFVISLPDMNELFPLVNKAAAVTVK